MHPTITCDCPATCFNCFFASKDNKGHYAFNDACPLKKNMRRYGSEPTMQTAMPAPEAAPVAIAPPPASL